MALLTTSPRSQNQPTIPLPGPTPSTPNSIGSCQFCLLHASHSFPQPAYFSLAYYSDHLSGLSSSGFPSTLHPLSEWAPDSTVLIRGPHYLLTNLNASVWHPRPSQSGQHRSFCPQPAVLHSPAPTPFILITANPLCCASGLHILPLPPISAS